MFLKFIFPLKSIGESFRNLRLNNKGASKAIFKAVEFKGEKKFASNNKFPKKQ